MIHAETDSKLTLDSDKNIKINSFWIEILKYLFLYLFWNIISKKEGSIIMIIERKEYLEKLIAWKDKQLIKIVTGVRRCGKSMLLEIYRNYLKEHGIEEEQIISINFE